jgi:hypothetical protein
MLKRKGVSVFEMLKRKGVAVYAALKIKGVAVYAAGIDCLHKVVIEGPSKWLCCNWNCHGLLF